MYRAVMDFADLQDHEHIYHTGDKFPRDGVEVSEERIKELSGFGNRIHQPLIAVDYKSVETVDLEESTEPKEEPKATKKSGKKEK